MLCIRDIYKLCQEQMRAVAAGVGVPDSYRMVLTYLHRHPGANQKDIAAFRNITTASVSQIVKEMQLTGYLRKEADTSDQRYVHLYLTERGEACAREILQRVRSIDAGITARLTPAREAQLLELLEELARVLGEGFPAC